jgi:AhpC/TSA family/Disulphide bond corrector protein DsbC
VELEHNLDGIRKQGLGVAAISYDSPAVLKNFADRQLITFPMLSDPESKIIRAFGILNDTVPAGNPTFGIPFPGTFIVDAQGKVVSKYFEDDYKERMSAADILVRDFGQKADGGREVETKHLRLRSTASTQVASPGHRIALVLEVDLKPKMHVYAPGVQGYIPIDWSLDPGTAARALPASYPASVMLHLDAIGETVPVYRDRVRIVREVTFGPQGDLKPLVNETGEVVLRGSFRYQACDDRVCFIPQTVPLEWRFRFVGLDMERAPGNMRRRP